MLYPLMLLGLLGLSVPIIIHLIQRQRLKPQQLATLRFLEQLDVANAFAPVPRDWLQLLLRLLLLALFVLVMCRPAVTGSRPGPRTLAVILDQSMSMQQRVDGQALFDRDKKSIAELIDSMGPEDKMALYLVGDRIARQTGYLRDRAELRRQLDAFDVSDGGALALVPAIRQTVNRLRSRREENAAVLVFSDQQRVNYEPYLAEAAASRASPSAVFARRLDAGLVKLIFVTTPGTGGDNLAITHAEFSPERVYLGASARLTAEISNLSGKEQTTRVFFYEGNQPGETRSLTLASNETARIDLAHMFESPVDTACRVEIQDDALPPDSRFQVPMRMRERRQVLLVQSREEPREESAEIRYQGVDLLSYALNPGESLGAGAGTYIQVRRITPALLGRVSLPLYSVVILYGLADVPAQSVHDLSDFVRNGGGLILIPDETVAPRGFNESLAPLLGGFALGQMREPDSPAALDRDEEHLGALWLTPLVRGEWTDVRDLHFSRYFTVAAPGPAQVLLRADNGDPLAALLPLGRGHVLAQLFSCDLTASSLPRTAGFVAMVQELVTALSAAGDTGGPDTMRVGDVLRVRVPEFRGLGGSVHVAGPETKDFPLQGADGTEIEVSGFTRAGAYEITHPLKKSGRKHWLTVNPVEGESSLAPLGQAESRALFGRRNAVQIPYAQVAAQFHRRREIFPWVAAAVLLAFLMETLFGAWHSRRTAEAAAEAAGGGAPS